jgi:translation initiation factor IF-3
MLGIFNFNEALEKAKIVGLDLVEVSFQSQNSISVCKIVDFSKFKYKMERKAKAGKKKQKIIQLKEIRIRPRIGVADLEIKIKRVIYFLSQGNKVQISMFFSGREIQHKDLGNAVLNKIKLSVSSYILTFEPKISALGNRMSMILQPKKDIQKNI